MLKTVLDNLDGLDETTQSFYAEDNGRYVLKVEGIDAHPEVANLKSAYERTKADREAIRGKLTDAEKRLAPEGFDLEAWKAWKEGKPDAAAQQQLVQLRQTLEAERDQWKGKYETTVEEYRMSKVNGDLSDAIAAAKITNPVFVKAARAMLAPNVKLDGEKAFFDTDMGPMGLTEYVKRWAASDEGKDFVDPPKGDGAKGNERGPGAGKSISAADLEKMSPQEKAAYFAANPGVTVT